VGITKCRSRSDLLEGLQEAACYDRRILVEQAVPAAREIEVSVLGNEAPSASVPGEIIPSREPASDSHDCQCRHATVIAAGSSLLLLPSLACRGLP